MFISSIKEKFNIFTGRLIQATPACLLMMTQGNFLAITAGHWLKAFQTGATTGLIAVLASLAFKDKSVYENKYAISAITAVATMISDYIVHPTHFGAPTTEAITTGLAAGLLCYIMVKTDLDKKLKI